jgi:hypothetical protein
MALDVVQLLALALVIAGIWTTVLLAAGPGVALILTGLIVLGAALAVERHAG